MDVALLWGRHVLWRSRLVSQTQREGRRGMCVCIVPTTSHDDRVHGRARSQRGCETCRGRVRRGKTLACCGSGRDWTRCSGGGRDTASPRIQNVAPRHGGQNPRQSGAGCNGLHRLRRVGRRPPHSPFWPDCWSQCPTSSMNNTLHTLIYLRGKGGKGCERGGKTVRCGWFISPCIDGTDSKRALIACACSRADDWLLRDITAVGI